MTGFQGAAVTLVDARETSFGKGQLDANAQIVFPVAELKPATYTIKVYGPDGQDLYQNWVKAQNSYSRLVASPNPAITGIDKYIDVTIMGGDTLPGPFSVKVTDAYQASVYSDEVSSSRFQIPARPLVPGTYLITVQQQDHTIWQDSLEVLLKDAPYLTVSPNPTTEQMIGQLQQAVPGLDKLTVRIVDQLGTVRWEKQNCSAVDFPVDMRGLPPMIYQLVVNDGVRNYTLLIQKL